MPSERSCFDLEQENSRLKKIVADLSLDKEMLQNIVKRRHWLWICVVSKSPGTKETVQDAAAIDIGSTVPTVGGVLLSVFQKFDSSD